MSLKKRFKEICEEYPDFCDEMASEDYILNNEMMKICQKQGIKFNKENWLLNSKMMKICQKHGIKFKKRNYLNG
jgi:hypothetical protein